MMKVLHIGKFYPPRWGGMETAVKDICETIAGSVELDVIVANDSRKKVVEDKAGYQLVRLPNWKTLLSQPLTPELFPALRKSSADIVHLHEPNPLALACFLASRHSGRLVIHYHSDVIRQKRLSRLYRPLLERGLARADAVVVGSAELLDSSPVLKRWRRKCVVIPFGIDLAPFLAIDHEKRKTRKGPPRVVAVGRLSYYKGFHHLIDAAAELDCEVLIGGDGELRKALEQRIRNRGVSGSVRLLGSLTFPQLVVLYQEADIFCLPSCERSEAFGLAMVEAMGSALPVVSTDLPTGVRAVNRHGETGIVVEPGSAAALASALRQLASNQQQREEMGMAGRLRARRLFSREAMGRSILGLYRMVTARTGGGAA
jgi:rhamnosyl/mannosyltransferase